MIELRNLSYTVPATETSAEALSLVAEVSLDLSEPRICLIGANGSGKSTLLRLIAGLRQPTTGAALVAGYDTVRQAREVRSRLGFIFTDPLAQLVMPTPLEDVELSLRRLERNRSIRRQQAMELLAERGLGHLAHRSIYDISGGERQLVALASVLAVKPEVIVADEPTTLLDLRNTQQLRATFADLPQQIIYSTHNLDFATDADRVLVIDHGRIVADDTPAVAVAAYQALMAEGQ
ncbi:MAG: cobalt ABC transporter ATP-binding protein [Arachnia propionica]|nr:MAG: cobalt ABC transporter ATP-binding protein [Arachnia propionica]